MGGGGGLGRTVAAGIGATAGGALGGPVGAGIGAAVPTGAGAIARALYNGMTKKQIEALDELVRSRSPLGKSMQQNAPWEVNTPDKSAALARLLAVSQDQSQ